MGAAILLSVGAPREDSEERFDRVAAAFPTRVRGMAAIDRRDARVRVRLWSHEDSLTKGFGDDAETGAWLALVGNPTRDDLKGVDGKEMLARLLDECQSREPGRLLMLSPPFAAAFHDEREDRTHVAVDRCGLQHLYATQEPDGRVWISSSCLALATALGADIDTDALAEWLTAGHFLGQRTLFKGIRKLGSGELVAVDSSGLHAVSQWQPRAETRASAGDSEYVEAFQRAIDQAVAVPGRVAGELTGGLDSRLVLAGLLGQKAPFITWTFGQAGCAEMVTIARLQRAVDFSHSFVPLESGWFDRLPELVQEMHELSDGEVNALEYCPLLLAFEALRGRRAASLSGGGGEIGRGFYYRTLHAHGGSVRGVSVDSLLRRVASATGPLARSLRPEVCGDAHDLVRARLVEFIEASPAMTPAGIVEDFYVRARMQRFAGRNVTTTGLFCRQGLPFFANDLVDTTLGLPQRFKSDGRVVRRAVMRLDPRLAAVPLDSGIPVLPAGLLAPAQTLRKVCALGRKALRRFGGGLGRALAPAPPDTVPWGDAITSASFGEFANDLVCAPDAAVRDWFAPEFIRGVAEHSMTSGRGYLLGLLLTVELTARRVRGRVAECGELKPATLHG